MFVIFINDLPEAVVELVNCFLFADDAKLCKHVHTLSDRDELQRLSTHMLTLWSERWMLKLNLTKCSILSVKRKDRIYYMIITSRKIQVICSWKDVGKSKIWESSLTVS